MLVANNAQTREADRLMAEDFSMPALLLMETAGRKSAEHIRELYPDIRNFLILCGAGSNGGDGLVVARYLHLAGLRVWVIMATGAKKVEGDAAVNLRIVTKMGIPVTLFEPNIRETLDNYLQGGTLIVDAMIGTGFTGTLREPISTIVKLLSNVRNEKVAIDMPTGLIGDTGAVNTPPLKCSHTLTFQLPKVCHYVTPASLYCGKVHVLDIGILPNVLDRIGIRTELITEELIRDWYRPRADESHKGNFGHVLLAGGSKGMPGAIAMAASGSVEIGAGLCTAFIPGAIMCSFHRNTLENMSVPYGTDRTAFLNPTSADVLGTYLEGKNTVAIGPGLGVNDDTRGFLAAALERIPQEIPLVLDADALNILAEQPELWKRLGPKTVLTPHPGEMARLMGIETSEVQQRRYETALQLAREKGVVVVLKGAGTVIASPEGTAFFCNAGNPGMATGGAGDVLTGAISGLLAQGYSPLRAAAMGVYIHACTGDRLEAVHGQEGITATKIMRAMGETLRLMVHGH